ncbi:uncharacterized protein LOC117818567 [Notolabrus celidotus]|uniref:uncharacterized protein LOC117818567 n=1 Tax=Notolabrus celidotus TaxID=1203425 RepID=UPI00148FA9B7|nr:uncharacterized protein LOC117818567 [Notolabrus celidotus]
MYTEVVCHGLSVGQAIPQYVLVKRLMPWYKAREFCQQHYIDLAVLNTEEQYLTLLNVTASDTGSFWLGLQMQNTSAGWKWVDGEELTYDKWYRRNYKVRCASLEAMLKKENKLLGRYCDELHMFVCRGPIPPQSVGVDAVSSGAVVLSWNVSASMRMTPHSYNVTICTNTCDTHVYHYTNGSTLMTIIITNLTSDSEFFIEISAFVVRPDYNTGGDIILQSYPTALKVKTVESYRRPRVIRVIFIILKLLKLLYLAPPLCFLHHILKKYDMKVSDHNSPTDPEIATLETQIGLLPERTRGFG